KLSSALKIMTVVGVGVSTCSLGKMTDRACRNCSSFVATLRMSLSLAFPMSVKFFDLTESQLSFAEIGAQQNSTRERNNARNRCLVAISAHEDPVASSMISPQDPGNKKNGRG